MGHFYCCGQTDKIRFDNEFLDVESRSRRVSIIHSLTENTIEQTINKVKDLQSILNNDEDEVQLYVEVKKQITETFIDSFTAFDKEFPNIKLRIYATDLIAKQGDPIEYYNNEISIMEKMKHIAKSSNNQDFQALYRQFT